MTEIEVEGFKVIIERTEGKFIASVPKLPGCTVQVDREEDVSREIRAMIGMYMRELASRKPGFGPGETGSGPKKRVDSERPPKIRK